MCGINDDVLAVGLTVPAERGEDEQEHSIVRRGDLMVDGTNDLHGNAEAAHDRYRALRESFSVRLPR